MRNYCDPNYRSWIKKVKIRDKHKCQWPGCDQKKGLQAHHILPWCDYIGLRYDINNGITLCKLHHKLIYNDETSYAGFFMKLLYNKSNNINRYNNNKDKK